MFIEKKYHCVVTYKCIKKNQIALYYPVHMEELVIMWWTLIRLNFDRMSFLLSALHSKWWKHILSDEGTINERKLSATTGRLQEHRMLIRICAVSFQKDAKLMDREFLAEFLKLGSAK